MPRKSAPLSTCVSALLFAAVVSVSSAAAPPISRSESSVWAETWQWFLAIVALPSPAADLESRVLAEGLMGDPNGRTLEPPPAPNTATQKSPNAAGDLE